MSESRPKKRKVEFIESYWTGGEFGSDYQWNDNHGELIRCKDCKHWDKTTRKEGNDCILGPWEDAECEVFRDWDSYGDLGENFRRTNGDWFCADGERRDDDA